MLGHIKPPICRLQPHTRAQYRHLYCSMCYSLRRQFGLPAGFLISHELTISLLACAGGLTAPLEYRPCPAQLFCRRRAVIRHEIVDKAARLNLLLVWLKLVDWETDSRKFYGSFIRKIAESRVSLFWADLSAAAREFIVDYLPLIKTSRPDFSEIRKNSGLLANHLFGELGPKAPDSIGETVSLMGEIIPVADALLDLKEDIAKSQYNPVLLASQRQCISLEQAYHDLRLEYENLAGRIKGLLAVSGNAAFTEVLGKSLARLSARIDREGNSAGPSAHRDGKDRRRQKHERRDCCDCCDCCECGAAAFDGTAGSGCCGCDSCACEGCCCDCGGC
jgi:hypothetical protein